MKKTLIAASLFLMSSMSFAQESVNFQGQKVKLDEDAMSGQVEKEFTLKDKNGAVTKVALVSQFSGGNGCPATYFFVDVNGGKVRKSHVFGTCSDLIKTSVQNDKITVVMPNMNAKGKSTYVYEDMKLTENGKLLK